MTFYPLDVVEYVPETTDSASFVFEIPEELRAAFDYKAGQFLNFQIPWEDFFIERCYSISS
ncbi:MAG: 3-ketosteroid-9-alpha-hydroxylase, partial [Halopseudomonas aestusnigri]